MYPKNPLFQKCLACLESLPNIKATLIQTVTIGKEPYIDSQFLADGMLTIQTPHHTVNYVCEIKTDISSDTLEQVVEYFVHLGGRLTPEQKPLLVTRGLSNLVVDRLLEKNIEFIDIDGNIYLNSPEIYAIVRNQISKDNPQKSIEISTSALQVMYALLSQPQLISRENDIASIAGVTPRTVKNTLKKLRDLDYIETKNGEYKIIDYVKLLERWELGYSEKLRARLVLETFNLIGRQNFSEVAENLQVHAEEYGYLIGGELAASAITEYLRPIGATLHLSQISNYRAIAVKLKLKPDPQGNIVCLKSFGTNQYRYHRSDLGGFKNRLVHPLLIHAELMCLGNSRLKETAQLVYDQYIENNKNRI